VQAFYVHLRQMVHTFAFVSQIVSCQLLEEYPLQCFGNSLERQTCHSAHQHSYRSHHSLSAPRSEDIASNSMLIVYRQKLPIYKRHVHISLPKLNQRTKCLSFPH